MRLYARNGAVDGVRWRWWVMAAAVPFHLPVRAYSRNRGGLRLYARIGMARGGELLAMVEEAMTGGLSSGESQCDTP